MNDLAAPVVRVMAGDNLTVAHETDVWAERDGRYLYTVYSSSTLHFAADRLHPKEMRVLVEKHAPQITVDPAKEGTYKR